METSVKWDDGDIKDTDDTSFLDEGSFKLFSTSPSYDQLLQKFCKNVSTAKEDAKGKPKTRVYLKPYQMKLALQSPKLRFPYPRFSYLSATDQRQYLILSRKFQYFTSHMYQTYRDQTEVQYFMDLKRKVLHEQDEFNNFLGHIAKNSPEDYAFLSSEVNDYLELLFSHYDLLMLKYPQHYTLHQTLGIAIGMSYPSDAMMKHVKTLLSLGEVPSMQIPYYGKRSYVSRHFDRMMTDCPPSEIVPCNSDSASPKCQPVSKDEMAQRLSEKYAVDIVISMSGLETLINNHPPHYEHHWQIPIRVTEHRVHRDDGTDTVVKTVYIDKPLLRKDQLTSRQKNLLFHRISFPRLFKPNKPQSTQTLTNLSRIFLQQSGYDPDFVKMYSHDSTNDSGSPAGGRAGEHSGNQKCDIIKRTSPEQSHTIADHTSNVSKDTPNNFKQCADGTAENKSKTADDKLNLRDNGDAGKELRCQRSSCTEQSVTCAALNLEDTDTEECPTLTMQVQTNKETSTNKGTSDVKTRQDLKTMLHNVFSSDSSCLEDLQESDTDLVIDTDDLKSQDSQNEEDMTDKANSHEEILAQKENEHENETESSNLIGSGNTSFGDRNSMDTSESSELTVTKKTEDKKTPVRRSARLRGQKTEDGVMPSIQRLPKRTKLTKQIDKEMSSLRVEATEEQDVEETASVSRHRKRMKTEQNKSFRLGESGQDETQQAETNQWSGVRTETIQHGNAKCPGKVVNNEMQGVSQVLEVAVPKLSREQSKIPRTTSPVSGVSAIQRSATHESQGQTASLMGQSRTGSRNVTGSSGCKKTSSVSTDKTVENILKLKEKLNESKHAAQTVDMTKSIPEKHMRPMMGKDNEAVCSRLVNMINPEDDNQKHAELRTGNVAYDLWTFGKLKLLVRSKVQGYFKDNDKLKLLNISPKLEYQPKFGMEKTSAGQLSREWIRSFIQPNTITLRGHINAYTSEVMFMEKLESQKLLPASSNFNLPADDYLLVHSCGDLHVCIYRSASKDNLKRATYHLGNKPKATMPHHLEWLPLDTDLTLLQQPNPERIPATFPPYPDSVPSDDQKHSAQRNKTKKKKRKRDFSSACDILLKHSETTFSVHNI
ncbi:little elongation complex subunit 2-like isoform X2 [Ptychodera flava]|uniref:little elongation complex subunit 2-like isoform X2 n=1 Tax=Ptychodera flava TaxID=63121 RepID=UPI003969C81B